MSQQAQPKTIVENLRCEYQRNPLGIDTPSPRFSWWLKSSERGTKQTARQICVASSLELLNKGKADQWDSGKQDTDESIQVAFNGYALKSNTDYVWKVRVWDQNGAPSAWSRPAVFRTGLLDSGDWKAQWIQRHLKMTFAPVDPFDDDPNPIFRKEFSVSKPVKRAVLYATGLGYFEFRLNGKKVGDHQLDPAWTDFSKRVSYQTFDVTKQLKSGPNAIGAMLGNGWFNTVPLKIFGINLRDHLPSGDPRMVAQLMIEYADGTSETVITDTSWKAGEGPIMRNSVYLGEVYDARNEQPGWDAPGFDDSGWGPAVPAQGIDTGNLESQQVATIRITKTLKPIKITEPKPGVFIVDYGQNFAGVTRMKVKGPSGTRVRLRSGELLYDDGTLNAMTTVAGQIKGGGKDYVYDGKGSPKTAFQIDEYVCKGKGTEVFQPRFTFHGFRYVEVTGYPGKPKLSDFEGLRMNTDVEKVGSFECSNPLFNRIQTMVEWSLLSNLFSVQSDCPHREKFGYGGDQVATSEMAMFTFDMARFYANTIDLLADSQRPNGGFTETAPFVGIADEGLGEKSGPVEWGSAFPVLLNDLHIYYGDLTPLRENYASEHKWSRLVAKSSTGWILDNGISDHESLVPKPRALTGTAFLYLNAKLIESFVKLLDKRIVTEEFLQVPYEEYVENALNKRFLNRQTGTYDIGTQACQAIPLALGFVPEDMKAKVLDVLIKDIEAHDNHLTTGIFGTKYLFQALSDSGRDDVAYKIANQRTFPGWGHMLESGATTMWEHWEFSDNTYSHNHPMFGSVSEWFYKSLAGIRPAAPGFKKIVIKPSIVGDLTWVKAHHDSPYGRIVSSWKREGNKLTMDVTIPPNSSATIYVPSGDGKVMESGKAVDALRKGPGIVVFEVCSGAYQFKSKIQ